MHLSSIVWIRQISSSRERLRRLLRKRRPLRPNNALFGCTIAPLERECFRFDSLVINPWMGKPGNEDRLLRTILHESGHISVKIYGYADGHGNGSLSSIKSDLCCYRGEGCKGRMEETAENCIEGIVYQTIRKDNYRKRIKRARQRLRRAALC